MKKLFFPVLLIPFPVFGQNRFTISGTIKNDKVKWFPWLVLLNKNNNYAVTEKNGRYIVRNVRTGGYSITIAFIRL